MQRRPLVSREKIEKILKIHDEMGGSNKDIGKLAGAGHETVKRVLNDRGASYLSEIDRFENETKEMREMFSSGMSTTEIGKKFGVKNGAVRHRCRDIIDKINEEKQKLQDAGLRKCWTCNKVKSLDLFGISEQSPAGRSVHCKRCLADLQLARKHDIVCQYPGCGIAFQGCCANRKYCDEHTINRWTYEKCYNRAKKYSSRGEFQEKEHACYQKCVKMGWHKVFFQEIFGDRLAFGFRKIDFIEACNRKNNGIGKLYLIKCFGNDEWFYKVGITSGTVKWRHKSKRDMPYNYEIIWTIDGDASEIWDMEKEYIRNTSENRYQPELWKSPAKECFKCHGNCKILRKPGCYLASAQL